MGDPERILVVAPHPDDEALGAGGFMAKACALGHDVFVALLTSGDGFKEDAARYYLSLDVSAEEYLHMGYERRIETLDALAHLGVPPDHVAFLGYPDGGLDALWRTHWDEESWTSPTTGCRQVPYLYAFQPDAPFRGVDLLNQLRRWYREVDPTLVIAPSAFDTHPDHWGTNAFTTMAWAEEARSQGRLEGPTKWGYLVHWPAWPFPLTYRPGVPEEAPPRLLELGDEPWHEERLTVSQVEAKRQALMTYESQVELIKPFMLAFARSTELFTVESEWRPMRRNGAWLVANPGAHRWAKILRRHNLVEEVAWFRAGDQDGVRVTLVRPWQRGEHIEVSLHVVDGSFRHYRLRGSQEQPDANIRVTQQDRVIDMRWPSTWVGAAPQIMAGMQLWDDKKVIGRIPVRIIPWEE